MNHPFPVVLYDSFKGTLICSQYLQIWGFQKLWDILLVNDRHIISTEPSTLSNDISFAE